MVDGLVLQIECMREHVAWTLPRLASQCLLQAAESLAINCPVNAKFLKIQSPSRDLQFVLTFAAIQVG